MITKKISCTVLGCTLAAALTLTACGGSGSGSSGSMSTGMGGSSSQTTQNAAWRTGLGILTEADGEERAGKINTIAAAVLLDAEGKVADVMLDEVEISVTGDGTGKVTMPGETLTKRQKGEDYPLAAVSSLKKGWAEQADAFGDFLTGKTPDEVKKLATDDDGKPKDADLLSGCTIAVDGYRDAVVRACENAKAVGSVRGDRAVLGVSVRNDTKDLTADDDHDVTAQVDITVTALTLDADDRVTGAIADVTEPALTVSADGTVSAPELVKTKLEQGDQYGMRGASALDKEWYEHSEGWCDYLKGRTRAEVASIPDDGSDADLAAVCTISVTELQKAALAAFAEESAIGKRKDTASFLFCLCNSTRDKTKRKKIKGNMH